MEEASVSASKADSIIAGPRDLTAAIDITARWIEENLDIYKVRPYFKLFYRS